MFSKPVSCFSLAVPVTPFVTPEKPCAALGPQRDSPRIELLAGDVLLFFYFSNTSRTGSSVLCKSRCGHSAVGVFSRAQGGVDLLDY